MTSSASRRALLVLTAAALTACARATPATGQSSPAAATPAQTAAKPAASTGSAALSSKPTQADIDFMNGMIGHHAQALVMAGWAPSHGASASVRVLCERIVNEQQDEITTMQRWLRDRQLPV